MTTRAYKPEDLVCTFRGIVCVPYVQAASAAPVCQPNAPCGCYGCAICNGAQAPMYGALVPWSTPVFGVPAACGGCGSATCNQCRAARGMGAAGVTPVKRSSAKATREKGYRVCSYDALLSAREGDAPGDTFATPDLAQRHARARAKAEKRTQVLFRDGERRQYYRADGAVDDA